MVKQSTAPSRNSLKFDPDTKREWKHLNNYVTIYITFKDLKKFSRVRSFGCPLTSSAIVTEKPTTF